MNDELYMRRCIELGYLGMGAVSPNPLVGCVIVCDGKIIGEGYHAKFGAAHAEVNAINDVKARFAEDADVLLESATAYVSLEPCAHFGKTPPCADLLVRHKLKKVVIGNRDPFGEVDGLGIEKLKSAGIEVVTGVLEKECAALNRRFFTRIRKQRPYVILKWAKTADGYFAPADQSQKWISGPLAKKTVHKWRAEEDAVLVGKLTAMIDDPELSTREWEGKNAIRILVDPDLQIPISHKIFNSKAKTVVFNELKTEVSEHIHYIQMEDMRFYLAQKIAFQLYLMDIQSIIIEGGASILNQFIDAGLWDEARIFSSETYWNEGILSPKVEGTVLERFNLGNDNLTVFQNNYS